MSEKKTNVDDLISELGAGIFKDQLATILSECAMATVIYDKKGKVTVTLSLEKVGDHDQVMIKHKLSHETPTKRGKRSEESSSETPMFVGPGGVLSIDVPKEDASTGQFNLQQEADGKPPMSRIK